PFCRPNHFIREWKPNDARTVLRKHGNNLDLICKNLAGVKRRKSSLSENIQRKYAPQIAGCAEEQRIMQFMEAYCLEHLELYGIRDKFETMEVQDWLQNASNEMVSTMLDYNSEYAEKHGCQKYWEWVFATQIVKVRKNAEEAGIKKAFACLKLNRERANTISVKFEKNRIVEIEQEFGVESKAFYIDSPRIVDEFPALGFMDEDSARINLEEMLVPYRNNLSMRYRFFNDGGSHSAFGEFPGKNFEKQMEDKESNVEMQKMDEVIRRFDAELVEIMRGTLKFEQAHEPLEFSDPDYTESFKLRNLSTGAKAISLLQSILHYRVLREKSVLILDEPEINLHPEWQAEYARIVVMLQTELNLHVVITTHSPFFLKALENAVGERGMGERCHYYYAQNVDGDAKIEKVDNDLEMVYSKMMMPLLDMLRVMPI
ncbi:MAG TPA: hypothetical protein DDY31_19935, partial [Lachnospiraceae bacterium]|nr:hypothetical protein [Lachnospiraceae bacterium]HBI63449.1 hypothetical protein [Lachnospiraceae bacterium]